MTEEERDDLQREERIAQVLRRPVRDRKVPPFSEIEAQLVRRTPFALIVSMAAAAMVLALVVGSALAERRSLPAGPQPQPQTPPVVSASPATTPNLGIASPSATTSPRASVFLSEAAAWQLIRETLPAGAAVAVPTWLPASVDRATVELQALSASPTEYRVVYRAGDHPGLVFISAPLPLPAVDAGVSIRVRRSNATLNLPQSVFRDPAQPALRRVQWREGDQGLRIESEVLRSDDLERIAWSLDLSTAPPPTFAYTVPRSGGCAGSTAEDTLRTYIALAGRRDASSVLDCHAREVIELNGQDLGDKWAIMPRATLESMTRQPDVAGRPQFLVSWVYASDPGGPAGSRPTFFFLLTLEEGAYRIVASATAPLGPRP